jgi:CheY-like chemotaxis protein
MNAHAAEPGQTVLLVDDDDDIRDLARLILETDGLTVVEASGGAQALEMYLALDPPPVPAAVILDQRMPGLTGLQVAEKMLARNPEQVILLFSAYLDPEMQDAAKATGVATCVSKIDSMQLPSIIRGLLNAA